MIPRIRRRRVPECVLQPQKDGAACVSISLEADFLAGNAERALEFHNCRFKQLTVCAVSVTTPR
jgi:hypothetical protein